MTMADTIAVMRGGRVEQLGSPVELYERPRTAFVANFLGQSNLLEGTVEGAAGDVATVAVSGRRLALAARALPAGHDRVLVGVRPEKLEMRAASDAAVTGENALEGVLVDSSFIGVSTQHTVRLPWDQDVTVFTQNRGNGAGLVPGDAVSIRWDPAHTFAVPVDRTVLLDPIDEDAAEAPVAAGSEG